MSENIYRHSRRDFLKYIGVSAPVIALATLPMQDCTGPEKKPLEKLYEDFRNPPAGAKPFFRWWWNGNMVSKAEISRELKLMKNAGAGGVEINPIAMPARLPDVPGNGINWLSEEWCEMVRYASDECRKNGMLTDLIVGTGWPFGGEFLNPEETIKGITVETHSLQGVGKKEIQLREPDTHEILYSITLVPEDITGTAELINVSEKPDADNILHISLPQGNFTLIILRVKSGFREVFRGSPGGAGPVLDHFNSESVQKYLNRMSDRLKPHFDGNMGNGLRAMFCDSIELQGANWTASLIAEFEKITGYHLDPFLPLLMLDDDGKLPGEMSETVKRVRYDLSRVLAGLFMENFILSFHSWCHDNHVLSRYQAYGMPWLYTDLVDGYMAPDIPEGDQWLYNSGWTNSKIDEVRYAIWNKYASSGGKLSGRRIISSEAMTNTSGVFRATLGYMKEAADLNFAGGINHMVLHGFNYSPPEAGFPGWVQYGTYYNEHNTWWPYISRFMDYASRLSVVFQSSEPDSQVAILGPTPDIWRDHGLDRNYFNTEPWYLHSLWQALSNHGITSDYINGSILTNAVYENRKIRYKQTEFDTLIVCRAETMEEPVARSILQYVEGGGKVIFLDTVPDRSPGLMNHLEHDDIVKNSLQRAVEIGAHVRTGPGEPEKGSMARMTDWTGHLIREMQIDPGVKVSNPDPYVFVTQYKHAGHRIVFIAHAGEKNTVQTGLTLKNIEDDVWKWDPGSGDREPADRTENGTIDLELGYRQSVLLVTGPAGNRKKTRKPEIDYKEFAIRGPWDLEPKPGFGKDPGKMTLAELRDLSKIPELRNFSGTVVYRTHFNISENIYRFLDLGGVMDIAVVRLNGKEVGISWYGSGKLALGDSLVTGTNRIEISVTNTLYNYCITMKNDPVIDFWTGRDRNKEIMPAGLLGPVKLSG